MVLRIILSVMIIIPFFMVGVIFLFNIGNEINNNRKDMELKKMAKRQRREMIARQERFYEP